MLAKSVYKWILKEHPVAYFFFNGRGAEIEQTMLGMARALLVQIVRQHRWILEHIPLIDHYKEMDRSGAKPPEWELPVIKELLGSVSRVKGKAVVVYVVIDSLDEAHAHSRDQAFELLNQLASPTGSCTFKIFLTSRPHPLAHLGSSSHPRISLEQPADAACIQNDIDTYVAKNAASNLARYMPTLDPIIQKLKDRSNGVFLWVDLVMKRLVARGNLGALTRELEDTVDNTPSGSNMDRFYQDILNRLDEDGTDARSTMLLWVLFSKRPLNVDEFQVAVTMKTGPDGDTDEQRLIQEITPENFRLRIEGHCGGLVELAEGVSVIQLIHQSAKEYLLKNPGSWLRPNPMDQLAVRAHQDIGAACLHYLTLPALSEGRLAELEGFTSTDQYADLFQHHRLLKYAVRHWMDHANVSLEVARSLAPLMSEYTQEHAKNFFEFQHVTRDQATYFSRGDPLHFMCTLGYANLVKTLLDNGADVNQKTEYGGTALSNAAMSKQYGVMKVLVGRGAKPDDRGLGSRSVLMNAVTARNAEAVQLLLDLDANRAPIRYRVHESLIAACAIGNEQVITAFLDRGIGEQELTRIGTTWPNEDANGNAILVRALSARGINIDLRDPTGCTAMIRVASQGCAKLIESFLDCGADVNAQDDEGRTALSWAAGTSGDTALDTLLRRGGDTSIRDNRGRSPLEWAQIVGNEQAIRLLEFHPSRKAPRPNYSSAKDAPEPSNSETKASRETGLQTNAAIQTEHTTKLIEHEEKA